MKPNLSCVLSIAPIFLLCVGGELFGQSAEQSPPPNLGSVFTNSIGLKFVPIPNTSTYFCIWDTRVKDYDQFVSETGRFWKPAGFSQNPDHPAVRISHYDATAFCEWLTRKEHASGILPSYCEYRLPMDLEWSAAAGVRSEVDGPPAWRNGGIPDCYAWGSSWPPPYGAGNFDPKLKADNFPYTSPVGSFPPNKYGLYDITGNVMQWISEDYDEYCGLGFLRGGSWPDEEKDNINLTGRCKENKDSAYKCFGFRCVIAYISQKANATGGSVTSTKAIAIQPTDQAPAPTTTPQPSNNPTVPTSPGTQTSIIGIGAVIVKDEQNKSLRVVKVWDYSPASWGGAQYLLLY